MRSKSSPPAAYSMTMPRWVVVTKTSLKRMMLGCSRLRWLISSRSTFLRHMAKRARRGAPRAAYSRYGRCPAQKGERRGPRRVRQQRACAHHGPAMTAG